MSTILITGGAGNIASALVSRLAMDRVEQIVIADNLLTGSMSKVPLHQPNVRFVKCDVNDYNDVAPLFFMHRFDYVFHFAAVVGVQRTLANPMAVLHDIRGIENVLNLSKHAGVKRIYFSSSSEVYGEPAELPQHENTTPLNSRLPYAVVKNLGEVFLRAFHQEYGLPYTIFRFFNTYGPNQTEDFVLPRFVRAALAGRPLTVYGQGNQTRTFCYVDDTVEACAQAHFGSTYLNDVINIGSADEITIIDLARTVIDVCRSKSTIEFLPALKEGDMTRRCPDVSKMSQLLRRAPVTLRDGIARLCEHYARADKQSG